jgi:leucyl-tRNA synthetase
LVPIIDVPGYGNKIAEKVVADLGIKSQNDRQLLDKAKEIAYQKGFYEGVMTVGDYAGMKVQDAKTVIRKKLIDEGLAVAYSEPESPVTSRSGDDCVVALIDQWYLDYGEDEWRKLGEKCLAQMQCFSDETRTKFTNAFDWMKNWACSRSYGLGTKLPWDTQFLIESLSDSTIYMAYYTIAHILQRGTLDGEPTKNPIKPEWITPDVFDFVFLGKELPANSTTGLSKDILEKMRKEFLYWYPVDLRVSGKDLVPNHLLFFIYNHVAMFPEQHWPKGVRANGHVLLNGEKMSKSTGNFVTLKDAVERYSADGMRFALAYAGDTQEDANFTSETADNAILKLYTQLDWAKEMMAKDAPLRDGAPSTFADKTFLNEMRLLVQATDSAYDKMNYREALQSGFFDLQLARDTYRVACQAQDQPMNRELIQTFIRVQALILTPVCPHWSEHIYKKILGNTTSVMQARWPEIGAPDMVVLKQREYLLSVVKLVRDKQTSHMKKKGAVKPTRVVLFVAKSYPAWQQAAILMLKELYDANGKKLPAREAIIEAVRKNPTLQPEMKKAMPFVTMVLEDVEARGESALVLEMPFSEVTVLTENLGYVAKSSELVVEVYDTEDAAQNARNKTQAVAVPGKPAVNFE